MMRDFEAKDGIMQIGGVSAVEIADRYGTPVYVTDEQIVRENYRRVYNAFSKYMDTEVHYACKANTNLAILSILEQEGSHIDAVSIGEVLTCIRAGFTPDRIMYTGVNVSDDELRAVVNTKCKINVDSESELERLAKILGDDVKGFPISFRITPGVASGHGAKVMTGGKGAKFSREGYSIMYGKHVVDKVWGAAARLGYGSLFLPVDGGYVTDDHYYINAIARIPSIDIVPYLPNCKESSFGPTWHTTKDNIDNIDKNVLEAVGKTLIEVIYNEKP